MLDSIFPFPFDKDLHMPPFPRGVELPKYEKYFRTSDPQDHLREFGALSMEFMHDQTYLMCLPMESRQSSHGMVYEIAYGDEKIW